MRLILSFICSYSLNQCESWLNKGRRSKRLQVPSNDDPTLADKEAILASLNIKAMTFDDTIGVLNHSKSIQYLLPLLQLPFL